MNYEQYREFHREVVALAEKAENSSHFLALLERQLEKEESRLLELLPQMRCRCLVPPEEK